MSVLVKVNTLKTIQIILVLYDLKPTLLGGVRTLLHLIFISLSVFKRLQNIQQYIFSFRSVHLQIVFLTQRQQVQTLRGKLSRKKTSTNLFQIIYFYEKKNISISCANLATGNDTWKSLSSQPRQVKIILFFSPLKVSFMRLNKKQTMKHYRTSYPRIKKKSCFTITRKWMKFLMTMSLGEKSLMSFICCFSYFSLINRFVYLVREKR